MRIEGNFDISAARAAVYRHITDPGLMAKCVPGCETIEQLSPTSYRALVTVSLGGIKARFNLVVDVIREQAPDRVLSQTRGEEGSRASVLAADNEVILAEVDANTTRVSYSSEVSITGRLGKFALGVMKKKAQAMGQEFAERLREHIQFQTAAPPVDPSAGVNTAASPGAESPPGNPS